MPKFQKEFPKDAHKYFAPDSDVEFQEQHPIKYNILTVCGIFLIVLPMIVLLLVTQVFFPVPETGFTVLAGAGGLIFGIGLFNILSACVGQYLGHKVTLGCLFFGGLLLTIGCVAMYVPDINTIFEQEIVDLYFATLIFLAVLAIWYLFFRMAMEISFSSLGKWSIKMLVNKTGIKNFLWYEEINSHYCIGKIYFINKIFTICYILTALLAVFTGWMRFFIPIVSGFFVLSALILSVMEVIATIKKNIALYKTPVIIYEKPHNGKSDCIILDFVTVVFPLLIAYAQLKIMFNTIFQ